VVVFDQQEWHRNVSLHSDLYTLDRHTGRREQLTRGARVQDPDLSPDGQEIVAVREQRGRRDLVLLELHTERSRNAGAAETTRATLPAVAGPLQWHAGSVTTLVSEPETQFNAPRWSPDGRSIAVARQRLGTLSEIVILDVASGATRLVASHPSARIVTPTWRPDGLAIVAAADYQEGPFDLYEFAATGATSIGRRLTELAGGARWPDISADGNTIVFVGYTADGFDLFTLAYPHAAAGPIDLQPPAAEPNRRLAAARDAERPITATGNRYSPWPTLAPTSWSPILETGSNQIRAGVSVGAADVLARHVYGAAATWLVAARGTATRPDRATPDWQLLYAYDRWRPTFFVSASSATAFGAAPPDGSGRPTSAILRSADMEAGVVYPVNRARNTRRLVASVLGTNERYTFADHLESRARLAARVGWEASTARTFGYSISREHGLSIGGTAEVAGRWSAAAARATTITGDARAYLRGMAPHHVLALRAAAGLSDGARNGERVFHLGGSRASTEIIDFGRQSISLLRGFPADAFAGTRVALLNGDYRFPIARPQRGIGTFPLLLHSLHAALFADAGHAWTARFSTRDVKVAVGGEIAIDVVAAYWAPLTIAAGAAWGRDGADPVSGNTVYVRIGRAF
jgi:hypothetical protein